MSDNGQAKRAILYARVSSDDRRKDGRNLDGQLQMCREYAERQGWRIVGELAEDDRGASGAALDLPELTKALEMAAEGEYDVLVVREMDRLARDIAKQMIVTQELKGSGVRIAYALYDYPDTPEGNLHKNINAAVAEYERLKITERTKRARRRKVKDGNIMLHNLPAPFGYRKVELDGKTKLAIEPEAADIVRLIFELYTGPERLSMHAITNRLTEARHPTPTDFNKKYPGAKQRSRDYGHWSHGTIGKILKRETYAGTWHYSKTSRGGENPKEQWLSVDVPAIVDRETWETAQRLREANKQKNTQSKYDYLLSRRLTCGHCGSASTNHSTHAQGKLYKYYRCGARWRPDRTTSDCDLPSFRADKWDATVWAWVRDILTDREGLRKMIDNYRQERDQRAAPLQRQLNATDELLEENRHKLDRALDLYLSGEYPREMLLDHKERLERERRALEERRAEIVDELDGSMLSDEQLDDLMDMVDTLADGIDEADVDFDTRRKLINALDFKGKMLVNDDGEKRMKVECIVGEKALLSLSTTSSVWGGNQQG